MHFKTQHFESWSVLVGDLLNSDPSALWPDDLSLMTLQRGHNKPDILCLQPTTTMWWLVCVCLETHAEVSVPDLDGAILAACCYELPITTVGAACRDDLLPLEGAWFEHRLVLLLWVQIPCAYSAVNRENVIYHHPLIKYLFLKAYLVISTIHHHNKSESYWDTVCPSHSHEHKVRQLRVAGWGVSKQQNSRSVWQACLKLPWNPWTITQPGPLRGRH